MSLFRSVFNSLVVQVLFYLCISLVRPFFSFCFMNLFVLLLSLFIHVFRYFVRCFCMSLFLDLFPQFVIYVCMYLVASLFIQFSLYAVPSLFRSICMSLFPYVVRSLCLQLVRSLFYVIRPCFLSFVSCSLFRTLFLSCLLSLFLDVFMSLGIYLFRQFVMSLAIVLCVSFFCRFDSQLLCLSCFMQFVRYFDMSFFLQLCMHVFRPFVRSCVRYSVRHVCLESPRSFFIQFVMFCLSLCVVSFVRYLFSVSLFRSLCLSPVIDVGSSFVCSCLYVVRLCIQCVCVCVSLGCLLFRSLLIYLDRHVFLALFREFAR